MTDSETRFSKLFMRGEFSLGFWSFVKKGVGFFDSFFILSSLSVYQYGVYQLLLVLYAIFSDIFHDVFSSAVGNDLTRLIGEKREAEAKKLFYQYASLRIGLSIIPAILFFFIIPSFYLSTLGTEAIIWLKTLALLFPIEAVFRLGLLLLNLRLEFKVVAIRPTLQKTIQLGLIIICFFSGTLTLTTIFFIQTATLVILLLLLYRPLFAALRRWKDVQAHEIGLLSKIIFGYGKWEIPQLAFKDLMGKVNPFVIKLLLNTEAVGIYAVANTAISVLKDLLPVRTLSMLVPRKVHDEFFRNNLFFFGTKYYILAALGVALFGAVTYPIFISVFFPKFASSLPVFYVLVPSIVIFAGVKLLSILLLARRRQRFLFIQSMIDNIIQITLMFILAPKFGLIGFAAAIVGGDLLLQILRYAYLRRTGFVPAFPVDIFFNFQAEEDRKVLTLIRSNLFKFLRIKGA